MDDPERPLFCKACRKWCNGPTQMEDHVQSKIHKKQKRLLSQMAKSHVSFLVTDMTEKVSLQLVSGSLLWPEEVTSRILSFVHRGSFIYTALGMDVREVLMSLVEAGVFYTWLAE